MIDFEEVQNCLNTTILRPHLLLRESVESTNKLAMQEIEKGAKEGLIVIAEQQSAGRGRYDRSWHSPKGGLYFTLVLRPPIGPEAAPLFSLLVSCAVVESVRGMGLQQISVKWPNDILLGHDKLAGILCELVSTHNNEYFIVAGVGVNHNSTAADFPTDSEYSFTTVRDHLGKSTSQEQLLCSIINSVDSMLGLVVRENSYESVLRIWRGMSSTLGNRVRVFDGSHTYVGIAEDLLDDGSLSITTESGTKVLQVGDVTHLRND